MNNQPPLTLDDRLREHVEKNAKSFLSLPRSIIKNKAEELAELFVASEVGLDIDNPMREGYKQQYIELFNETVIEEM